MKEKEKIVKQYFLNISDIQCLFGISRASAKKVYDLASELDNQLFNEYRIEERKVTISSACKVLKTSLHELKKRVA